MQDINYFAILHEGEDYIRFKFSSSKNRRFLTLPWKTYPAPMFELSINVITDCCWISRRTSRLTRRRVSVPVLGLSSRWTLDNFIQPNNSNNLVHQLLRGAEVREQDEGLTEEHRPMVSVIISSYAQKLAAKCVGDKGLERLKIVCTIRLVTLLRDNTPIIYKSLHGRLWDGAAGRECSICLSDFVDGEEVTCLDCKHEFHEKCIMEWLTENDTCPLCRSVVT